MSDRAAPLSPKPEVLDFLRTRRSRPPRLLTGPAPDRAALQPLLEAALRVPDHGKLEPWRLLVLEAPACKRLADLTARLGAAEGRDADKLKKDVASFADAPMIVAVISAPGDTDRIPLWEQRMSAACVCLTLVNAALASGWGASWLTGWQARHDGFLAEGLSLGAEESVAGFIHIGREREAPPDRPRPDPQAKIAWVSE